MADSAGADLLWQGWVVCAGVMLLFYGVARMQGKADVVDVGWVLCVGGLALWLALQGLGHWGMRGILVALVGLWSLRLAYYLLRDRVFAQREDPRYASLRSSWGQNAQRNFFLLFQLQALLALLVSISFIPTAFREDIASPWQLSGALILGLGALLGEHVADGQLRRFRADPSSRGRTCRSGLWRFSRHPNYFFEWLFWLSFVALGTDAAWGLLSLCGPVLMFILLRYVTGVPPSEAQALRSRGEEYREYQRTTSAFFPWFPARSEKWQKN